jgi:hypothetical protein
VFNVCWLSRCLITFKLLNWDVCGMKLEEYLVSIIWIWISTLSNSFGLSASWTELTSCGPNIRRSPCLTVPLLFCHRNVLTKPLSSNGLFCIAGECAQRNAAHQMVISWLSGVMSQYFIVRFTRSMEYCMATGSLLCVLTFHNGKKKLVLGL